MTCEQGVTQGGTRIHQQGKILALRMLGLLGELIKSAIAANVPSSSHLLH